MFFESMHPTWRTWLAELEPELRRLEQLTAGSVPPKDQVMRAFATDPTKTKVVLLGQDPYPTPGDAVGLAFAVSEGTRPPRSLVNIYKELESDLGIEVSAEPDIAVWQDRGVMLLNTSLTTLARDPLSHSKLGWQYFTKRALDELANRQPLVIMAWGNHAKEVAKSVQGQVLIIESAHPSPLSASRGFFGSMPFSRANEALVSSGLQEIDWSL